MNRKHLVYFAAWKTYISLYPVLKADEAFQKELIPYIKGKGTLQFLLSRPIPNDVIIQTVVFLKAELQEKKKS